MSCAAILGTMDHTIFSGIRIDFTHPLPSASFSELTAATHAFRKAAPHIFICSDCQSGISTVLKAAGGKLPRGPQGALTKSIRKKLTPPQLTWIESHPEKRKRLGNFEDGDCGIYFADRVAGKEYTLNLRAALYSTQRSLVATTYYRPPRESGGTTKNATSAQHPCWGAGPRPRTVGIHCCRLGHAT